MTDPPAPSRRDELIPARSAGRGPEWPLTPEQRAARRRNRWWLVGLAGFSVAIVVASLVASGVAESNQPNGPSIVAPAGYRAHRDGYFTYAVPVGWIPNQQYSDQTGDVYTSGQDGWVAEHIAYRATAPTPGEPRPTPLLVFGMTRSVPYMMSRAVAVTVPGADRAYRYHMTRPGGFSATVIDAWSRASGVEIWLVVDAPPGVTAVITSTLRG